MRVQDLFIVETAQQLNEINMSPNSLRQLASKIDAQAGMEFEMIVPNVESDSEPDMQPDYDQDTSTRSFDDIRSFFHDGDYNSRRAVDDLIEEIEGEFLEWQTEIIDSAWSRDGEDFVRNFVENNGLFNRDEAMEQARDEIINANPDLPQESEDFSELLTARLDELQEEFVLEAIGNLGRIYSDALEEFTEEQRDEYDIRTFLDDKYPYMTDIENNFDIGWPYYTDANEGSDGVDIDTVADDFSKAIGKPINASRSYHGARREAGKYVVEPDGSLDGDSPGDKGLEFVSPPMPITELLADLAKVKEWADLTGCYTNDSTGLHINVSVPALAGGMAQLDYVKLALLLGDERVLNEFGRASNTYTKSALKIVKERVISKPDEAAALLDQMKGHLNSMASKAIHNGSTQKFTSINTKTGYIEFRSPGGDWLDTNFELIEPTLLRFVVALDAATDPEKYRQEYLTKLYKILAPKSKDDTITHFAKFAAGELPKQALKSFVRQAQLERKFKAGKMAGQKMWWKVSRPGYFASVEVVAANEKEAIALGKKHYPEWDYSTDMTAKPIRAYEEPAQPAQPAQPAATNQDNWGVWIAGANRFARQPGQIDNNVLRRFPSREAAEQFLAQTRAERPDMRTDIEVREIGPGQRPVAAIRQQQHYDLTPMGPGPWEMYNSQNGNPVAELVNTSRSGAEAEARLWLSTMRIDPADYQLRIRTRESASSQQDTTAPGQAQQRFTGNWLLKDSAGTVLYRFGGVGNSQHDANVIARSWLQNHPGASAGGVEVVPEME